MTNANIGTPDFQRSVVAARKVLATVAANVNAVTVNVPPNGVTICVVVHDVPSGANLTVSGVTTGFVYPIADGSIPVSGDVYYVYYVSPAVVIDSSISVVFSAAPTSEWYVYSDIESHVSFDPSVSRAISVVGNGLSSSAIAVSGSDGSNMRLVATDSNGRLIPMVPTSTASIVMAAGIEQILAAPTSGAWYLFRFEVYPSGIYAAGEVQLVSGSGTLISGVADGGSTPVSIDMQGYRVADSLKVTSSVLNKTLIVRYAQGS